MPKISVVMPVYNGEKYLREAINSVLNQTYEDFEFIIINDCSIDDTENIILSYNDPRIFYYKNDQNSGVAATLNRGLGIAMGEYIARMDADDISLPERFEKQVEYLDTHLDVAVLGTSIEIFGRDSESIVRRFSLGSAEIKVDLLFSCALAHPTVMMRKNVLEGEHYRYDLDFDRVEDYELWWRISQNYKIATLPDCLLKYRKHSAQVTKNYSEQHIKKLKNLKRKQIQQLGLSTDTIGFEQYFYYCINMMNNKKESIVALLDFLIACQEANKTKQLFNDKILSETCVSIVVRFMKTDKVTGSVALYLLDTYRSRIELSKQQRLAILYKLIIRKLKTIKNLSINHCVRNLNSLRLKNQDFTIVSNNCWAGFIYQKYGLEYQTPTIGLEILGNDYIKFCHNLRFYTSQRLEFIEFESSRFYDVRKDIEPYPVGVLYDIEIHFKHYESEKSAKEKWERRCKRINWDKVIYKISYRDQFIADDIRRFLKLDLQNKLCFTPIELDSAITIPELDKVIGDETSLIAKYFDERKYLNEMKKAR